MKYEKIVENEFLYSRNFPLSLPPLSLSLALSPLSLSSDPTHHVTWREPTSHTRINLFVINNKSALNYYIES